MPYYIACFLVSYYDVNSISKDAEVVLKSRELHIGCCFFEATDCLLRDASTLCDLLLREATRFAGMV